jgi:hypothetical protein
VAHYGILEDTEFLDAAEDIRGSHLYGVNDEELGKIDDVIFDHSSGLIRHIVVDTGDWLTTKKFIVPAHSLRASAQHKDDFETSLSKQQVESFPPYQQSDLDSDAKWVLYEGCYPSKWETSPLIHRAGTDRTVTRTTPKISGNSPSAVSAAEAHGRPFGTESGPVHAESRRAEIEAASSPTDRVVPAGTDSVLISNSGVGIGGRWDAFQSRLRERRRNEPSQDARHARASLLRTAVPRAPVLCEKRSRELIAGMTQAITPRLKPDHGHGKGKEPRRG